MPGLDGPGIGILAPLRPVRRYGAGTTGVKVRIPVDRVSPLVPMIRTVTVRAVVLVYVCVAVDQWSSR